ncbi:hypothetical protein Cni_G14183 [Canna indica]|uniref:NAC domain-containing protein n=1 Tax=Canna indica TaxID=4628 RepID=A0AAQ3KB86_9LILI|nr:hypothetical protein Cni_G14183 [Canna indica]
MSVIPLERLPRGFRFHPTDEELINHYLKRKITGRIEPNDDVIPEIDVCKCEPWDLPGKSLIKSDDPEWFFFAPKDRKYPTGLRTKRATEAGYWKATGKDRQIRPKAAAAARKRTVIGMKKTLVFHRGRAPNGMRTNWIMHEYRTTEPEFESGDQGGYVLYRLFKKPEENSSNSNTEEMETGVSSPTSNKYSPNDTQCEAYDMEENGTSPDHGSPNSDMQEPESLANPLEKRSENIREWSNNVPEHSTNYSAQPDENYCYLAPQERQEAKTGEKVDGMQDVVAQLFDSQYQQIGSNSFPNISSPMLPCADHPFLGNSNNGSFPVDNAEQDSLNDLLNSMLNTEECSSLATMFENDSFDENVLRHSLWESASGKNISCPDTEVILAQRPAQAESFEWLYGSSLSANPEPQLKTENTGLVPYGSMKTELDSIVSSAQSSRNLLGSTNRSNNQKDRSDSLEEIGIEIRSREHQLPPNSDVLQGIAARRIHLQSAVVPFHGVNREYNISKNEDTVNVIETDIMYFLLDNIMETTKEEGKQQYEETGTNIRCGHAHRPPHKLSSQLGTAARGILLRRKCKVKLLSSSNIKSGVGKNRDHIVQVGGCANKIACDVEKILGPAFLEKLRI